MLYFVYVLTDPSTSVVMYVGITGNPNSRLSRHLDEKKGNEKKNEWIQRCIANGSPPTMRIIEVVEDGLQHAREREKYWVQYYLSQGCPLTNQKLVVLPKPRLSKAEDIADLEVQDEELLMDEELPPLEERFLQGLTVEGINDEWKDDLNMHVPLTKEEYHQRLLPFIGSILVFWHSDHERDVLADWYERYIPFEHQTLSRSDFHEASGLDFLKAALK